MGSDFLIGSVSYTAESIGIINVDRDSPQTILDAEGSHFLNRLGASIAYDTRNNGLLPDRGQRSEFLVEAVAGDASFYKLEAKSAWFFPGFVKGHVLEVGIKGGTVEAIGSFGEDAGPERTYTTVNSVTGNEKVHTVKNLPHNDVPFFERYFLGGAYSLRGYKYRDVSPQESGTRGVGLEPVGGNSYYMAYAEYSIPIIENLRVAAFYDMGNVYYNSYDFDVTKYSSDVGLGLRLNIPRLGPLRFDYGIPLHDDNNLSGGGRFNFSVGYTRDF